MAFTYDDPRKVTPASAADVIKFINAENQYIKNTYGTTNASPISGGTPAGQVLGTVSSTTDPNTGITTTVQSVSDGWGGTTTRTVQSQGALAQNNSNAQSAYDLLYNEFKQYGLESLVEPLKGMIQQGATGATLSLALQNTDAYKQRFSANQDRIKAGLSALSPAQYIALEDQYQNIMRNYGLPASYYSKDSLGTQAGFNKLIAGDVSATELEQRVIEAQQKVNNANPEVKQALRMFYPGISEGDILAYSLDPNNALNDIKRKVAAAEIGGSALAQGLTANQLGAEGLAAAGITKAQAQQGYQNIASYLPTATALSDIYGYQGGGPFTQATAEAATFGTAGAAEAQRRRKKLSDLEQAQFASQSGTAQSGALSRDRAITNYMLGTPGAGAF